MDILETIKVIKKRKRMTNDELSRLSGISLGTLNKLLAGATGDPQLSTLEALCGAFGCTLAVCERGGDCGADATLTEDEAALIRAYRTMPHDKQAMMSALAGTVGTPVSDAPPADAPRKSRRKLPLYNMPVSAGCGSFLDDGGTVDISIPDTEANARASYAVRVSGDSMEPKFKNGDFLLVDKSANVEMGDLGLFLLDGDAYFKRYGGDRLISLNKSYADISLEGRECVYLGLVIGRIKRTA